MTFQMQVGQYVVPISKQMGEALFEEVIFVDSLPPFKGNKRPDVEAVIKPEILFCYGNAVGTISGYIEAKVQMRVTGYDLGGRVIWEDEAVGESVSKKMNLAAEFIGGMNNVGKTGYNAAFLAAVQIIRNFNSNPPDELISLLEVKGISASKSNKKVNSSDIFQSYHEKGNTLFKKKEYYQALYSFEKAYKIKPKDLPTVFYLGVCNLYTAQKNQAMKWFKKVIELNPKSQEATDSKKWLSLLAKPLTIGIVFSKSMNSDRAINESIYNSLKESRIYNLIDTTRLNPPSGAMTSLDLDRFLSKAYKNKLKIVVYINTDSNSKKFLTSSDNNVGDIAKEYSANINAKAFSTKKKKLHSEITIKEKESFLEEISSVEQSTVKKHLFSRGADKLVYRLIANDIY